MAKEIVRRRVQKFNSIVLPLSYKQAKSGPAFAAMECNFGNNNMLLSCELSTASISADFRISTLLVGR